MTQEPEIAKGVGILILIVCGLLLSAAGALMIFATAIGFAWRAMKWAAGA